MSIPSTAATRWRGARRWLRHAAEQFWFIPGLMSIAGYLLAEAGIAVERRHGVVQSLPLVYDGGVDGARTMLGAIAAITVGVAGTVSCLTDDDRHRCLRRHADLLMTDARTAIVNADDIADVEHRYQQFLRVVDDEHRGRWTVPQRG